MAGEFKLAYGAGRNTYIQASRLLIWLLVIAAIVVAAIAKAFSRNWYTIVGLEVVLVVLPGITVVNWLQRRQPRKR